MNTYLITDCGSTTTKAILIAGEGGPAGRACRATARGAHEGEHPDGSNPGAAEGGYRLVGRGEAPTTVEAPVSDIRVGVRAAVAALQVGVGQRLLRPAPEGEEPDPRAATYLSTSSAGGGLQMAVLGVAGRISTSSAERAALAAGAIVSGRFSLDDGLSPHERIAELRRLRPDMILLAGGTEGGALARVAEMAEWVAAAGGGPAVVYAGNRAARAAVAAALGPGVEMRVAGNVRPTLEREVVGPAREVVHEVFMEHVMARAPGYPDLLRWAAAPVLPTPSAVGLQVRAAAEHLGEDVLAVDIGGATTDVFSVAAGRFHRSVSANYGMSYSALHVLAAAGAAALARWLPFALGEDLLIDRVANKMARPTTVPATWQDLLLEQALAREAIRLAFAHHLTVALAPRAAPAGGYGTGIGPRAGAAPVAPIGHRIPDGRAPTAADPRHAGRARPGRLGLVIGSGGVLSHAPRRAQAALMLLDAIAPVGFCRLAVDSVFMMPHLGALSVVDPAAADQVFWRDCLVPLATTVAPAPPPRTALPVGLRGRIVGPDGTHRVAVAAGELAAIRLPAGQRAWVEVQADRGGDLGAGPGRPVQRQVEGGAVGLILDARGRPLRWPPGGGEARAAVARWLHAAGAMPAGAAGGVTGGPHADPVPGPI